MQATPSSRGSIVGTIGARALLLEAMRVSA
jgi:hypothetical protein